MQARTFQQLTDLAYQQAGIRMGPGKEALVDARVSKRVRALGLASPEAYVSYLAADRSGGELTAFLDVITTNHTSFFREPRHFDLLGEELDARIARGQRRLRIWCAASSSGEEPYSILITALERLPAGTNFKLLATDLSTQVLERASAGLYPADAVDKLSSRARRWFKRSGEAGVYQVDPVLRSHVIFKRLNLAVTPFPMRGPLDAVFCRNVMIYFDTPVRQRIIDEVGRLSAPDALFCIGHSETLSGLSSSFKVVEPSVYRSPP